MFNTNYTPYMLHQPRKTITITKSSAIGCTVGLAEIAIKHLKGKSDITERLFPRSLISMAVSCNLRVED